MALLKCLLCLIYINLILFCSAITNFTDVLDNDAACEIKCTDSYAPHTYPNGEENSSCQRGCRLYTITKFISSDEPKNEYNIEEGGKSHAMILCYKSCIEAYNETSPLEKSCRDGCEKQEYISLEHEKIKAEEQAKPTGLHTMTPFLQIREVTSRVMGILRIIKTSITTFFRSENNEVVAIEGPVNIVIQLIKPEPISQEDNNVNEIMQRTDQSVSGQSIHDNVVKVPVPETSYYSKLRHGDFVTVINYSVMAGMLLAILLIIFIIVSRRSAILKKSKTMKLTMAPSHTLPVKLVRPEDLTKLSLMDEEEAPRLPMKVKLPDNTSI